jgi:trehalose 6-phosphate phosphatase
MPHDAASHDARWALFLDVDGTLLEIAATPESVFVSESLKTLLKEASERLDGALALISGRAIADLDRLFAPLKFCAAGIHGAELRGADGRVVRAALNTTVLREAREDLESFAALHPGILLEDKSFALAVHFRLAPHLESTVRTKLHSVMDRVGADYVLQPGKLVFEIRPAAWTKGTAVRSLLSDAPFAGRMPVYIGDDLTDEHAFEAVNDLRGISVRVGEITATKARFRLGNVAHVQRWLREPFLDALEPVG